MNKQTENKLWAAGVLLLFVLTMVMWYFITLDKAIGKTEPEIRVINETKYIKVIEQYCPANTTTQLMKGQVCARDLANCQSMKTLHPNIQIPMFYNPRAKSLTFITDYEIDYDNTTGTPSMRPSQAIAPNETFLLAVKQPFENVQVGDVIIFTLPGNSSVRIDHRVIMKEGGKVWTQGDASPVPDEWVTTKENYVATVFNVALGPYKVDAR